MSKNKEKKNKVRKHNDIIYDKRIDKNGVFPAKVYESRESILTVILQDKHINPIYSICVSFFIVMVIKNLIQGYLSNNEFNVGSRLITIGFSQVHLFAVVWGCMFLSVLAVFYAFKFWTLLAVRMKSQFFLLQFWKYFGFLSILTYYGLFLYFPTKSLVTLKFGVACNFATTMEVCRLLMKVHSFVRSNVPKIIHHQPNKDMQIFPKFSSYFYFLFAPVLIYKDSYPRSKERIKWNLIAVYAIEFGCILLLISYVYERGFLPYIKDFGLRPYTAWDVFIIILQCFPFGLLTVFSVFYSGLHIWLNAFAEIMGFSDRLFYKDWWTCSSFGEYYRKWNVPVHDWLYTYVYKDFCENVIPNQLFGRFLVFFISGVFHEYVLSFACGFCLPVCIVQIFITVIIMELSKLVQSKFVNSFFWLSLGFGISLNSTVYLMEYYARINCPIPNSELSSYDFFIPRFLSCYK